MVTNLSWSFIFLPSYRTVYFSCVEMFLLYRIWPTLFHPQAFIKAFSSPKTLCFLFFASFSPCLESLLKFHFFGRSSPSLRLQQSLGFLAVLPHYPVSLIAIAFSITDCFIGCFLNSQAPGAWTTKAASAKASSASIFWINERTGIQTIPLNIFL